jgi:hypothetical protein
MVPENDKTSESRASWGKALLFGTGVALLILNLFGYWFTLADRYVIFLYYHDMGPLVPDTTPFSRVTASRYWMAGLVAAGAVMLLYIAANWLLGRLSKKFQASPWWRVWLVASLPLIIGIPSITTQVNEPVLPLWLSMQVVLATLAGLALALPPGEMAARNPSRLFWLAADGWGLALLLLTLPQLEDIKLGLSTERIWPLMLGLAVIMAGLVWLLMLSFLRAWLRLNEEDFRTLILAGFCVAYVFLPFVHHTMGTDGYFYLTDSDNFFARSLPAQLLAWLVTLFIAWGIMRLRTALDRH